MNKLAYKSVPKALNIVTVVLGDRTELDQIRLFLTRGLGYLKKKYRKIFEYPTERVRNELNVVP